MRGLMDGSLPGMPAPDTPPDPPDWDGLWTHHVLDCPVCATTMACVYPVHLVAIACDGCGHPVPCPPLVLAGVTHLHQVLRGARVSVRPGRDPVRVLLLRDRPQWHAPHCHRLPCRCAGTPTIVNLAVGTRAALIVFTPRPR